MSVIPEQTVYLPFSLAETPDSLPTVAAYKRGVDGTFATQGGMLPEVVNVSGLAYYASAIIPTDAEPGDGYTLMVSVTVGGESSVYWLDCGVVGYPGLTSTQDQNLTTIKSKTDLLGTDALVPIVKIDTTTAPWEMVTYDFQDGTTEVSRRQLMTVDGQPVTSVSQVVGQQLKV